MNWKKFILLSCVLPCVFGISTATAQMMGQHRPSTMGRPIHRPSSIGMPIRHPLTMGMPVHRAATSRMPVRRSPMVNSASRFQRSDRFHAFNRFNDGDFDADDGFRRFNEIIIFDNFGFPFSPFFVTPFFGPAFVDTSFFVTPFFVTPFFGFPFFGPPFFSVVL